MKVSRGPITQEGAMKSIWIYIWLSSLTLPGCIHYTSVHRDPDSAITETRMSRDPGSLKILGTQRAVLNQPSSADPGLPLLIKVTEQQQGMEEEVTTIKEYKNDRAWSPLLIPVGLLVTIGLPVIITANLLRLDYYFADRDESGCPKYIDSFASDLDMTWGGGRCKNISSDRVEDVRATGRNILLTKEVASAQVKFELKADFAGPPKEGESQGAQIRYRYTNSQGEARFDPQELVNEWRETPRSAEMTASLVRSPDISARVTLSAELVDILHRSVREERLGKEQENAGHWRASLEHYSKAYGWLRDQNQEQTIWQSIARVYERIDVKPAEPEEVHRLLVQADQQFRDGKVPQAEQLLREAISLAPWHPPAQYNLARLQGLQKKYPAAVGAMKRYLELVPDASDAREARDMIYRWEAAQR